MPTLQDHANHTCSYICDLGRHLGLVDFDTKGSYAGYSSQEATFPNNEVKLQQVAWQAWLASAASVKEHALLDALIRTAPNEMLRSDHPEAKGRFDFMGSAVGPLSRMELPKIRRALYALLASLPPDRWYDVGDWVARVQRRYPTLLLDPATRSAALPKLRAATKALASQFKVTHSL